MFLLVKDCNEDDALINSNHIRYVDPCFKPYDDTLYFRMTDGSIYKTDRVTLEEIATILNFPKHGDVIGSFLAHKRDEQLAELRLKSMEEEMGQ